MDSAHGRLASREYWTDHAELYPDAFFGLASDRNNGSAHYLTFSHTHRFEDNGELKTQIRRGSYYRDQRAGTVRFAGTNPSATNPLTNPAAVGLA